MSNRVLKRHKSANPLEAEKMPGSRSLHRIVHLSTRGKLAHMRGLRTLAQVADEIRAPINELEDAPKAEWHHDTSTGAKVWMYDPKIVWAWWQRRRLSRKMNRD